MNLLLLPPHPSDISLATFKAAYGPGLKQVFSQLKQQAGKGSIQLDIVLCSEQISKIRRGLSSSNLEYIQSLLNQTYTLIAAIQTEDDPSSAQSRIDARLLLAYRATDTETDETAVEQGPVTPLKVISTSPRPWTNVYALDGEPGEAILQDFIQFRKAEPLSSKIHVFDIHRVSGGTTMKLLSEDSSRPSEHEVDRKHHWSIAVGGTFDHLHLGHKLLLTTTALVLDPARASNPDRPRMLTIGITTTSLLANKAHATVLESWPARQKAVIEFMTSILDLSILSVSTLARQDYSKDENHGTAVYYTFPGNLTVRCVEIDDAYGPTITDEAIDALVVSAETRKGGEAVNNKRREKGWKELEVYEVGVLDASPSDDAQGSDNQDFKSKISSTEIRRRLVEQQR